MQKLGVSVRLHSHEERGSLQRGTERREKIRCQVMGRGARETVLSIASIATKKGGDAGFRPDCYIVGSCHVMPPEECLYPNHPQKIT